MCLAIPAEVVEIFDKHCAVVNIAGVTKSVSTVLVDDLVVGDFVIIHVGHALTKLDKIEAQKTLGLIREMYSDGHGS